MIVAHIGNGAIGSDRCRVNPNPDRYVGIMVHAPANGLCNFIDASPSPFHVCVTVADELESAGFVQVAESDAWPNEPGRFYLLRGGSIVAWATESSNRPTDPFRVVGGHTDSPNLRVKQNSIRHYSDLDLVALEPYGGPLLNSWLDRDLGVSGRISIRQSGMVTERLVHVTEPLLRVPQLAIHLAENRHGVELDPQRHLDAIWGSTGRGDLIAYVAAIVEANREDVLGFELMTHDVDPSAIVGADGSMISAPRLDNQATCFAATRALVGALDTPADGIRPVLALFDHEEVGSVSDRGAASNLLSATLERIVAGAGGGRTDFLRSVATSVCASADMAHATHPNYVDRHEPGHHVEINGGPVLKVNQKLRYATDAISAGHFALACEQASVPMQRYVHRADLPCGSTVGPITAAGVGMLTVDVGAPQLAMHSARELMGVDDIQMYADALEAFFAPVTDARSGR